MQIWTQRISDKTNKEEADLRKEMDENPENILREMKIAGEHNPYQTDHIENKTLPEQGPQNT